MPKYRQLHIKILDSFDFAEMPDDFTRVVWLLLIAVVDSEGRGIDNPAWLRSKMFPLRHDVELTQIEGAMDWLGNREMVERYQVGGKYYFQIYTWKTYQTGSDKEGKSVLPAPPIKEKVTPEELPTYSEPTPPQYNTIQDNTIQGGKPTPNIFSLYQQSIGVIDQIVSEKLKAAEVDYPAEWIPLAFERAVEQNVRKWAYVHKILDNWKRNGFSDNGHGKPTQSQDEGYTNVTQQRLAKQDTVK